MKLTKRQLKHIIKEELLKEFGNVGNFGGVAGAISEPVGQPEEGSMKDDPDSAIQEKAIQFFANLEITEKVVGILVNNIAIPDLITIMEKVPKIDTAEEELHEVYSDEQRRWACAQDEEKFKEMCTGPMKKKKGKK